MSTPAIPAMITCPNCAAALPPSTLLCLRCRTLTHGAELKQFASEAQSLEAAGYYLKACAPWQASLPLLPPESADANWIRERIRALRAAAGQPEAPASTDEPPQPESASAPVAMEAQGSESAKAPSRNWIAKLGRFGPFALLLFKLKSLFSFAVFIVLYVQLFGWRYGLGISAAIFIHEMGHYIDIKRRGLPADMPVFLPGLGAYVRWTGLGITPRQVSQIALAGPLAGWVAAAACFMLYAHDPAAPNAQLWAALARTGAVLNTLNLIPIWILDGGKAIEPLGLMERGALLAEAVGIWLYTGEGIFILVALGTLWRVFTAWRGNEGNSPEHSDWGTWAYYAAVLIALALLLHATPNVLAHRTAAHYNS